MIEACGFCRKATDANPSHKKKLTGFMYQMYFMEKASKLMVRHVTLKQDF